MPRWLWIVLLLALAGYGWRRTAVGRARGAHEIVVANHSGRPLEQMSFTVSGFRMLVASLEPGATARRTFRSEHDGTFDVAWRPRGADDSQQWSGGRFAQGPVPMRHRFEFVRGDGIVWRSERRPAKR